MMQLVSSQYVSLKEFVERNWAWALGGVFGVLYGIKTFPMKIPYLAVDWILIVQLAKVLGLGVLGGASAPMEANGLLIP